MNGENNNDTRVYALSPKSRSIGCESDPSDDLGQTVYLWTLIRLVDVWVDEGNECEAAAYEQMVRVCNHGKAPLPQLLRLPPVSASYLGGSGGGRRGLRGSAAWGLGERCRRVAVAGGRGGGPLPVGVAGREIDSGSILAPLMEKLMETGHLEEFVEQVDIYIYVPIRRGGVAALERTSTRPLLILVCAAIDGASPFCSSYRAVRPSFLLSLSHRSRRRIASLLARCAFGGGARTIWVSWLNLNTFADCSRYCLPPGNACRLHRSADSLSLSACVYSLFFFWFVFSVLLVLRFPFFFSRGPPGLRFFFLFRSSPVSLLLACQALGIGNFRAFLATSVAHVLPVFVAGSKAAAVERLAALCDHFEVPTCGRYTLYVVCDLRETPKRHIIIRPND